MRARLTFLVQKTAISEKSNENVENNSSGVKSESNLHVNGVSMTLTKENLCYSRADPIADSP